jgi:hypothetical protein
MREAEFDRNEAFSPDRLLPLPELLALLPRLVNRARIESAGSKTGFEASGLLDEVELDVRIDLEQALPVSLRSLSEHAERRLSEAIRGLARAVLAQIGRG